MQTVTSKSTVRKRNRGRKLLVILVFTAMIMAGAGLAGQAVADDQEVTPSVFQQLVADESPANANLEQSAPAVTFPDSNLEFAIRIALNKLEGEEITAAELAELTYLDAGTRGIADLSGIEHCTNLITLILWDNEIADVSPLSGLSKLTWLFLGNNRIGDISPLLSLSGLAELYLWNNQVSDISPLASLTNLSRLNISGNRISDILPLVENDGLGEGDVVWLRKNHLDLGEGSKDLENITVLQNRGVQVHHSW